MAFFRCGGGNQGGISTDELYEALQYSGLVTPDMSEEEMLEVLEDYFIESISLFELVPTFTTGTVSADKRTYTYTYSYGDTGASGTGFNAYSQNLVDLTKFKTLTMNTTCVVSGRNGWAGNRDTIYVGLSKSPTGTENRQTPINITGSTGTTKTAVLTWDVSNLIGEYYVTIRYETAGSVGQNKFTINEAILSTK